MVMADNIGIAALKKASSMTHTEPQFFKICQIAM